MALWWMLFGAAASAPVWILIALLIGRRTWVSARRMAAKARGRGQLLELGQLAGGLAHEIKNPLSTININLQLLIEDLQRHEDELHRRWLRRLEAVQGEANRLKEILDDFLRYAGKYELSLAPTDLRKLVSELTDFFAPQADAARVVVRTQLADREVVCRVDANLVKQALLNLMINAVQAMTGGGELIIRISTQRSKAVLEVIDTGPGIPPEDLTKVFQVYYSTKAHGTGLGLPTTRRIIREHDGAIRVESEVGKGTRFVIMLPLAK